MKLWNLTIDKKINYTDLGSMLTHFPLEFGPVQVFWSKLGPKLQDNRPRFNGLDKSLGHR